MRRGPHGSIQAQEGLEAVLMASAFEQRVSVVLVDDGVNQLQRGQSSEGIGRKNFSPVYKALEMYGVDAVLVEAQSLARRGLARPDLLIDVDVRDSAAIAAFLDDADVVLSF